MYLATGLAIGGAVGANWQKVKPILVALLGPAAEGFQDAYGDVLSKLSGQVEAFQDARAETTAAGAAFSRAGKKKRRARKAGAKPPAPSFEPLAN
jgi:hypothetical protein